ncbi:MAG: hypothetical protein JRG86_12705 [Deltaproteobacteria bacterium]|nr:hypothetical protein [Deltaproteobacteria bacterium]
MRRDTGAIGKIPKKSVGSEADLLVKLRSLAIALTLVLALSLGAAARGDEMRPEDKERKSMVVATVLALDPFPATALAYSGKTGQAIGSGVVGLIGLGLIGTSAAISLSNPWGWDNSGGDSADEFAIAGLVTYGVSLAWDGIGGLYYTRKHNKTLDQAKYEVRPHAATDGKSVRLGLRVDF